MRTCRFEYIPESLTLLCSTNLRGEPLGQKAHILPTAAESTMQQIILPLKLNGTAQILMRLMVGSIHEGSLTLGFPQPEYSLTINTRPPLYIGLRRYINGSTSSIRLLVPLVDDGRFDVDTAAKGSVTITNGDDKELIVSGYESILPYYHVLDFNLDPQQANTPISHFRNAADLRRQVFSK